MNNRLRSRKEPVFLAEFPADARGFMRLALRELSPSGNSDADAFAEIYIRLACDPRMTDVWRVVKRAEAKRERRFNSNDWGWLLMNCAIAWLKALGRSGDERCKSRIAECQHEMSKKDVSIGTAAAGGYGLPKEIAQAIEVRVRQLNPFRDLVDVVSCSSNDFNYLVSMGDGTAGWSSETGTRSATNSPTLRNRAPTFGELYALTTASNWSLEDIQFDVQQWLVDDISAEWASQEATAIISGNGSSRPTGILNASPSSSDDDSSPMRSANAIEYIPVTVNASPFTSSNLLDSVIDLVGQMSE